MANGLNGRKVAVLATDGVEQVELTAPVQALRQEGAEVHVVAPQGGTIQGWNHFGKADRIPVDRALEAGLAAAAPGLEALGHRVAILPPLAGPCSVEAIRLLENGLRMAGSDPRRDGWAGAY